MNRQNAIDLIGEAKGLFPMMTDEQARVGMELLEERDDPSACRRAIRLYAGDTSQFIIATFKSSLPPKPSSGESWDRRAFLESKSTADDIGRKQASDNAVVEQLDDFTFGGIAKLVSPAIDADVREWFVNRGRKSQVLRSLVADYARVNRIVGSKVLEAVL